MIQGKTITLVVPCHNEAGIIKAFIRRVPSYVDEILVVDNNSTDGTAKIAAKAGARVVRDNRTVNGIGYGFAHQTGIEHARGDYIVAMDGDDTYPTDKIADIVRFMEKRRVDFVSCNRLPLIHTQAISLTRTFGIRILNMLVWALFGYPIQDILSGMWIGKRSTLLSFHAESGDWNFSPEIKLAALSNKSIHFSEYHISHFERTGSVSKQNIWRTGIQHVLFIFSKRIQQSIYTLFPNYTERKTYA